MKKKLMRSLIKIIANSEIGVLLRNTFKFNSISIYHKINEKALSVSDAFLWRTDNGFKTKFKFADIINIFYKLKNSKVEIHFYSNKNEFIKILNLDDLNLSNEIEKN